MKNLMEFLQEDNGGLSATRLAFLLWVIAVLGVWIAASVTSNPITLARIDPSVITVLGILMTGKVVQKFGEKSNGQSGGTDGEAGAGSSGSKSTTTG